MQSWSEVALLPFYRTIMVMTFPSVIGAAGLAFLLTKEFNRSVLDMLRARRHTGSAVA